MSDIYKEFGVDLLCARHAGPTAAEMKMAQEITRLRARVSALERAIYHKRAGISWERAEAIAALEAKP